MMKNDLHASDALAIGNSGIDGTIERYQESALARGLAPSTMKIVKSDIRKLLLFMRQKKLKSLTALTAKHLHSFQVWLADDYESDAPEKRRARLSVASRAKVIANLRSFFKFLYKSGALMADFSKTLLIPRVPKPLPRDIPTVKELTALIRSQHEIETPAGIRNAAIISTLFATGIRRQELCNLTLENVDLGEREIRINMGKGGTGRTVVFATWAKDLISEYLKNSRPHLSTKKLRPMFLTDDGRPFAVHHVGLLMKRSSTAAKLNRVVNAHALRHAFCTYLLKGGASIRVVNELAGHKLLRHTARYTRLTVLDLKKAVQKCHPRGN